MLERASNIIKKLQQLVDENANTEVLLTISEMLVAELQQIQSVNIPQSVSVTMPRRTMIVTEVPKQTALTEQAPPLAEEKKETVVVSPPILSIAKKPEIIEYIVSETEPEAIGAEQLQSSTLFLQEQELPAEEIAKEELVLEMQEEPIEEATEEVVTPLQYEQPLEATYNDFLFNEPIDIPTLPNVEVASLFASETNVAAENEVNNRFKEHKVEVAHLLENSHIKDLRRAISINDKYLFVNELFNGDEALYDKSIKQIQGFSILPEATFWIQRELKIKLNWPTDNEVVQLFDQLVKRRFS